MEKKTGIIYYNPIPSFETNLREDISNAESYKQFSARKDVRRLKILREMLREVVNEGKRERNQS
jgi:hypothetical protein